MGVAINLNLNRNACNYDHPLPNMLKLHCMVAPTMCIYCFLTFSGQFFLLSVAVACYTLSKKKKK